MIACKSACARVRCVRVRADSDEGAMGGACRVWLVLLLLQSVALDVLLHALWSHKRHSVGARSPIGRTFQRDARCRQHQWRKVQVHGALQLVQRSCTATSSARARHVGETS